MTSMKHNSDEGSDTSDSSDSEISDSELDDYEEKYYRRLQSKELKVKYKDDVYRCPFSPGKKKQDYPFSHLLQHADGQSRSKRSGKGKAKHLALAKFLRNDLVDAAGSSQLVVAQDPPQKPQRNELFVWPWMGVLANVPRELKNGKYAGGSGNKTKEELCRFNPLKVHPLWTFRGHTGYAIVDFSRDWGGFKDAMEFEKHYEAQRFGKKDWNKRNHHGSSMYGWVAREDDYKSDGPIGNHLHKYGNLKTVTDLSKEEFQKKDELVANLKNQIEAKNEQFQELEYKYNTTSMSLDKMMEERDKMHHVFNEEIRNIRNHYRDYSRRIIEKTEKMRLEMEKKLDDRHKKLANLEQKKVDENVLRLVEEQKKEKEGLLKRMLELERQQDAKQKLELEIEQLRGQLQVMSHMDGEDSGVKKKMDELKEELDDKIDDLDSLRDDYQTLAMKERMTNDVVQDVRHALIEILKETQSGRANIGIKRMGELDDKPFQEVCNARYPKEDAGLKAAELSSKWQDELRKPEWHPYKMILINGKHQEVIDEEDKELKGLRNEYGEEVYGSVVKALLEMNEYNGSGRYIVSEMWHFKENRKASPGEVVRYLFVQMKNRKRKRERERG